MLESVWTYQSTTLLPLGTLVRVPFGQREVLGVVWALEVEEVPHIRPISAVLEGIKPLPTAWRQLIGFTARYYQRSEGEVGLAALPPQLRELSIVQIERYLKNTKNTKNTKNIEKDSTVCKQDARSSPILPELTPEQHSVLATIQSVDAKHPFLLFGATGSGKTEIYLRCVQTLLEANDHAQALVMVPEINLTPQLEARFQARFTDTTVVSLHSGMTPAQRLKAWLAAHSGTARIVLGTRMAIFASMPHLGLIVVDEEHDPSYKSQEGARYSARDLAIYRAKLEGVKVILGSATPSLESWFHSRPIQEGARPIRYWRLEMPSRIGTTALPLVRRVDMSRQPRDTVFSAPLLDAMQERIARGEQCMVFLNRRGYAPILHCDACGWKSECPYCSAFRVFHKIDRTLRCHHCGFTERVPRGCPECGNADIAPLGRGTERLEEHLAELLPNARIVRMDADTTRYKGSLETQLDSVHAGEVDILVGTQMIAKGHDFRKITLVAAINPDAALFSSDFRAAERLFSLLMQAGGRAGRDADLSAQSEVWLQTFQPAHPLYATLKRHDYPAFAESQLLEREQAGLPPFMAQALVRAEARTQEVAQTFLKRASEAADACDNITLYPAVPMSIQRVANVERAQMLIESTSRSDLQRFLSRWQTTLHTTRNHPDCKGLIRWAVDVDPLGI
ncbi:MAG: primosomal protein [Pseudomonadota bacterium]